MGYFHDKVILELNYSFMTWLINSNCFKRNTYLQLFSDISFFLLKIALVYEMKLEIQGNAYTKYILACRLF